jgi:hypothetical protein
MMPVPDEGTWFAVPLRSNGFAVGVVARTSPGGGVVLAYFFQHVWDQPPPLSEVKGLKAEDAVRVLRVGSKPGGWDLAYPGTGSRLASQRVDGSAFRSQGRAVTLGVERAPTVTPTASSRYSDQLRGEPRTRRRVGCGSSRVVLTRLLGHSTPARCDASALKAKRTCTRRVS